MYSIRELEEISGIKAHTIRIWEKRYQLLKPERSDTNIRTYTDAQLVKLLNVSSLINAGWKISKISELSEGQMLAEVEQLLYEQHDHHETFITELLRQAIAYNEAGFERTLSYNILRMGIRDTVTGIIYPFLNRLSLMWQVKNVNPAQEHFASNLIRRKLCTAIDGLPVTDPNKPLFLLYLPEGEYHELGLLVADFLIRAAKCRTVYLGCDVPYVNLLQCYATTKPDYIFSMFTNTRNGGGISEYLKKMSADFSDVRILLAGMAINEDIDGLPQNVTHLKNITILENMLRIIVS